MRRRAFFKSGVLVLSFGITRLAFGSSIIAVRVWPASEYSRITIESDDKLTYQQNLLSNPNRLLLKLESVTLNDTVKELATKVLKTDPNIAAITAEQKGSDKVEIIVVLKQSVKPNLFHLEPVGPYKNRMVIDLYPQHASDALDSFLAQVIANKNTSPRVEMAQKKEDPLEQFITNKLDNKHTSSTQNKQEVPYVNTKSRDDGSPRSNRLIVLVLDPGHGGEDPGAIGPKGTREKDVVLRLGNMLHERINGTSVDDKKIRTFFTRDADYFVPLGMRVKKAMAIRADLFVSLHADAFITPNPQGASVYALSQNGGTSAAARWLANSENQSDLIGGSDIKAHDIYLKKTILDMSTAAQIQDSMKLGNKLLKALGQVGRLHKRYVEQAGFAVLKSPNIPSVLVESAFISNPEEEEKLNDTRYLEDLAEAIANGITHYLKANPSLARRNSLSDV